MRNSIQFRINIKVKSWIRIRIHVSSEPRIRIKVIKIRNTEVPVWLRNLLDQEMSAERIFTSADVYH
jgi:hypothetical protein